MGGEKTYYIEYSWSICDVKIDDFTEYWSHSQLGLKP
jgi:hypothetical protein